jgi:hypothetical protein
MSSQQELTNLKRAVRGERIEAAVNASGGWLTWLCQVAELTPAEAREANDREERAIRAEASRRFAAIGLPSMIVQSRHGHLVQARPRERRARRIARGGARDDPDPEPAPPRGRLSVGAPA